MALELATSFPVAQLLLRFSTGVREVKGSIPFGDFFRLSQARDKRNNTFFLFHDELEIDHASFFIM